MSRFGAFLFRVANWYRLRYKRDGNLTIEWYRRKNGDVYVTRVWNDS